MKLARSKSNVFACVLGTMVVGLLNGCTTYYKVTDLNSGKAFYTTSVKQNKDQGRVEFIDARTKSQVTLQSSEVATVTEEQFKAAVGK